MGDESGEKSGRWKSIKIINNTQRRFKKIFFLIGNYLIFDDYLSQLHFVLLWCLYTKHFNIIILWLDITVLFDRMMGTEFFLVFFFFNTHSTWIHLCCRSSASSRGFAVAIFWRTTLIVDDLLGFSVPNVQLNPAHSHTIMSLGPQPPSTSCQE